jgi:hypothetical protein
MYKPVGSGEIIDRVEHIRELHRQIHRSNDLERIAYERREQKIKDFISNLRRTDARPMANMVSVISWWSCPWNWLLRRHFDAMQC